MPPSDLIHDPNPYLAFTRSFARLVEGGRELPLGGLLPVRHPMPGAAAPVALGSVFNIARAALRAPG